ncbi:MAG: DUF4468 domain-containing protein [Bacteroidetes bacterium]|nr:DUF4468 domain-containing protein [Bacteroidota bacterium]
MNRLLIIILLTFVCMQVNAQSKPETEMPIDETTKLVTYTNVIEMPDNDKGKVYDKALAWANAFYKNPTDVIRDKDVASGIIICKARFKIMNVPKKRSDITTDAGMVQYTLKIEMKDNRYKYTLTDINWKQVSYYAIERWMDTRAPGYSDSYADYLNQTNQECKKIIADLVSTMVKKDAAKSTNDW